MKRFSYIILFLMAGHLWSQSIDVKWSERMMYDNKLDGFFSQFIGANSKYTYAKFNHKGYGGINSDKRIKLVAFNRDGMSRVAEARIYGYVPDKQKDDMRYYRTLVLENLIYILWTKEEKGVIEIYAETFDNKLSRISKLKKIYEINSSKKATDNLLIVNNGKIGNKIIIGREFAVTKEGENLRLEYKLINEDLSLVNSGQVTLPIIITKNRRSDNSATLICTYEQGNDGYLYVKDMVKVSDEEKKSLRKGEASVYPVLIQIAPETGDMKYFNIKFKDKNTFNFSWIVTKSTVRLYGFFSDLEKDPKGKDTHGIFYMTCESRNFSIEEPKFTYFDRAFLDKLYASDKEDQKQGGAFQNKKAKASDMESIDDNYVIESVFTEGGNTLLFCTIMRNWQQTTCTTGPNGSQNCVTHYYCTKRNITAFKFDVNGNMVWASNLDRIKTYSGWNIPDLSVISEKNKYYAVYGSEYRANSEKKNSRSRKSRKEVRDRLEYAVFEGNSGDYKKTEYQVNNLGTKPENAKYVSATNIWIYDNQMFTECANLKNKPGVYFSCLCPPLYIIFANSGNFKKGNGFMGTISPSN